LRKRKDLEYVYPIGKPSGCYSFDVRRGGIGNALESCFVVVGISGVNQVFREHVGFAAESTDAFNASNESGAVLGLYPLQFGGSRAFGHKLCHFFVYRLLAFRERLARPCRRLNVEKAANLRKVRYGLDIGGDLIVINQAFIESRRLTRRE